jgi:hypothetical protein
LRKVAHTKTNQQKNFGNSICCKIIAEINNANKKGSGIGAFMFCISLTYLLPAIFAIIKMIKAINPTTRKMPHTIPALKIPSTIEQLLKPSINASSREKIDSLIPRFI